MESIDRYEQKEPGYRDFMKWLYGKCFKNMDAARKAYQEEQTEEITCAKCEDTGIDPHRSSVDMGDDEPSWIPGYCDRAAGTARMTREMCNECGEKREDCICGKSGRRPVESVGHGVRHGVFRVHGLDAAQDDRGLLFTIRAGRQTEREIRRKSRL